nr:MAG: hypothetical protein [Microvirus sp.]
MKEKSKNLDKSVDSFIFELEDMVQKRNLTQSQLVNFVSLFICLYYD